MSSDLVIQQGCKYISSISKPIWLMNEPFHQIMICPTASTPAYSYISTQLSLISPHHKVDHMYLLSSRVCPCTHFFLNQVFMIVKMLTVHSSRSCSPASLQEPIPCSPQTSLQTSSLDSLFPIQALKSPSIITISPAGRASKVHWKSSTNFALTPGGALAVGAYADISDRNLLLVHLEPPHHLCPCCAICSQAVTILELTASQGSPAFFHAAVACWSNTMPTPSFLIRGSPSPGKVHPECNKVRISIHIPDILSKPFGSLYTSNCHV